MIRTIKETEQNNTIIIDPDPDNDISFIIYIMLACVLVLILIAISLFIYMVSSRDNKTNKRVNDKGGVSNALKGIISMAVNSDKKNKKIKKANLFTDSKSTQSTQRFTPTMKDIRKPIHIDNKSHSTSSAISLNLSES